MNMSPNKCPACQVKLEEEENDGELDCPRCGMRLAHCSRTECSQLIPLDQDDYISCGLCPRVYCYSCAAQYCDRNDEGALWCKSHTY